MTNILVLSDIHANLEALQAVLDHAQQEHGQPDQIWCLGDIVGYGPDPGACIDMLRGGHSMTQGVRLACVKGNHDIGVLHYHQRNDADVENENEVKQGWRWTAKILGSEHIQFLKELPDSIIPAEIPYPVRLVHISPAPDSREEDTLEVPFDVQNCVTILEEPLCCFGHTHLACYFECDRQHRTAQPRLFRHNQEQRVHLTITESTCVFVNPGTVGQPRWGYISPGSSGTGKPEYQGEPRASYIWLTLDTASCAMQCHFVEYDVQQTVTKLNNLPQADGFKPPEDWKTRLEQGKR